MTEGLSIPSAGLRVTLEGASTRTPLPMFERLKAARTESALASEFKKLVADCDNLIREEGQSISIRIAAQAITRFQRLDLKFRQQFYEHLATHYNPELDRIEQAVSAYRQNASPEMLVALVKTVEPPRQELLRRLNRAPNGTAAIVQMREEILAHMKSFPALHAVDADFEHLLSSWFNPGFLRLEKIDWMSPAHLLEKVIQHEAVHAIDGWSDLRRRLQPDRRLFAYFHPALQGEPLIFVEVALLPDMPDAMVPLLDRTKPTDLDPKHYKVAAFYSISNCQPGLKGIHLGNFLIKRVAEQLKKEFPAIKTFCTLSPIPSLTRFLRQTPAWDTDRYDAKLVQRLQRDHAAVQHMITSKSEAAAKPSEMESLKRLCAAYLAQTSLADRVPSDPVAKFHLNNGAQLDRINTHADTSAKGHRESLGLMVNYRYELDKVEERHEQFVAGEIATSAAVRSLLKP